jgi:hypothetical protein
LRDFPAKYDDRDTLKNLQEKVRNAHGKLIISNEDAEQLAVILDRVAAAYSETAASDQEEYIEYLHSVAKKLWAAPKTTPSA